MKTVKFFFLWIVCVKWETQFWIIFVLCYWEVATNTDTVLFFSNKKVGFSASSADFIKLYGIIVLLFL